MAHKSTTFKIKELLLHIDLNSEVFLALHSVSHYTDSEIILFYLISSLFCQ